MPDAPLRPRISLGDLDQGDAETFVRERDHDGVEFRDLDLSGVRARDREIVECLFTGVTLDDAVLGGSRVRESRFERCTATSLGLDASTLREVELDGCRVGALDAYDAELRQVRLTQCRLGYVNLRGAQLTDVELVGCQVEDLDLGGAVVERMAFVDCTVGHLLLPQVRLSHVDLRGAVAARDHDARRTGGCHRLRRAARRAGPAARGPSRDRRGVGTTAPQPWHYSPHG